MPSSARFNKNHGKWHRKRELSVDLLITFLHMNDEGVVTIHGVGGTPGADWCVTIAASDSNGGEYVFTEHQRDQSLPTHDDGPDAPDMKSQCEEDPAAGGDAATGRWGRRENGLSPAAEKADDDSHCQPGPMLRLNSDIMSISENDDESRCDDGEEELESEGTGRGGGREGGTSKRTVGDGKVDALSASPVEEKADRRRSTHDGRAESTRSRLHTPTPPTKKPSSFSSGGQRRSSSPVNRFAKWIVQNAHFGGRKKRGSGDNTALQDQGTGSPPPQELDKRGDVSNADCGDSGDGEGASTKKGDDAVPPASPKFKPRLARVPHVRGFVPKREVEVSMTCPLPSKLPFQPDQTEEEFDAPMFGTTVLGNSHGFDPKG